MKRSKLGQKNKKMTLLHLACINPHCGAENVKSLIAVGANPKDKDASGASVLHYAAANASLDAWHFLLTKNVKPSKEMGESKEGGTPLHACISARRPSNLAEVLERFPQFVAAKDKKKLTPLLIASKLGDTESMQLLMERRAKANDASGYFKYTPLCWAAVNDHKESLEFLLTHCSNMQQQTRLDKGDKYGRTPLMLATRYGRNHVFSELLRRGADALAEDTSKNTALHYAAAYNRSEHVKLLLKHTKANPSAENVWRTTPLSVAMLKGHFGIVQMLMS